MKNCFIILVSLLALNHKHAAAQQSIIRGVVSIQNSETNTGKRQYVSNAQVEDDLKKATPALTGSNGEFKLVYVGIGEKKTVSFQVKKQGLSVVDPTRLAAVAGQEAIINISMANPDSITAYRVKLFNIGKTEAEKKLESELLMRNQQLLALKKDGLKNAGTIKTLQDELEAIQQKIEQQATAISEKYAQVNLDDASRLFRLAFMHFQKGDADIALTVLSRMDLANTVNAIVTQRLQHPGKDTLQNSIARDAAEALALKAEIHKTEFEFDSAAASYELALKIEPVNENYLSNLADLLPRIGRNQDARINYNKALVIYRRKAITQPEIYRAKVALTLDKLGDYAYGWDTDTDMADPDFNLVKSKTAYLEAIAIYRNLAKQDANTWQPYLAGTLADLAGRIHTAADMTPAILEAIPNYQEAVGIYRQLAKNDFSKYAPMAARTLIDLAGFYRKTFAFTSAAATLQDAITLYRQMAKDKIFLKAESYIDYCSALLTAIAKDKNQFVAENSLALETVEKYRQLATTDPAAYSKDLAKALTALGLLLPNSDAKLFIAENAKLDLLEVLDIYQKLAVEQPAIYQPYIAETWNNLAAHYHNYSDEKNEALCYLELIDLYQQLLTLKPGMYKPLLANAQDKLKALAINDIFFDNAGDELLQHVIEVYKRLAKKDAAAYGAYVTTLQNLLAGNYGSHAWFLLMEAGFEAAEKMAAMGLQTGPSQVWIKANLAHALLFQGKYTEAVKVYTVLKTMKDENGRSFVSICLEDLDAMEKKNITHKDVARIRRFLIE